MPRLTTTCLLVFLSAAALTWPTQSKDEKKRIVYQRSSLRAEYKSSSKEFLKLQTKAATAKAFVRQKGFDTSFCFLVDMSLPANHKRFFVYDFDKDTIQTSGLVTHGNCNQYWLEGRKYSNEMGCGCTSLGRYKIGSSYYGRFGLAFKLYGLDKTNSNAFKRYVVLHSHDCVPDTETEDEICQSNGCPTVSPQFLETLTAIIKKSKKPVLLWIYE